MTNIKLIFAAAALCGGLTATAASAIPVAPVAANTVAGVEQAHWVCGPYRCGWRPNYYGGGDYAYGYYPRRHYWRHHYHRHYW